MSQHGTAFASTGRLIRLKGYDLALRALARIFARRGGAFSYRIAGTGPELDALRRLAEELGIERHVEFLGWVEPPDLPSFFASADIFLHPARWEPFGIAVVEAMACANVVIGSDATGAVLDRIRPGVNGFLHRADDEADLVEQIERALALGSELARVKRAARRSAEEWPVSREIQIVTSLLERIARSA